VEVDLMVAEWTETGFEDEKRGAI